MQYGTAPAMRAKQNMTYFGNELPQNASSEMKKLCGVGVGKVSYEVSKILSGVEEQTIARELMQYVEGTGHTEKLPKPKSCKKKTPTNINIYSDGSPEEWQRTTLEGRRFWNLVAEEQKRQQAPCG